VIKGVAWHRGGDCAFDDDIETPTDELGFGDAVVHAEAMEELCLAPSPHGDGDLTSAGYLRAPGRTLRAGRENPPNA
jgi:hypothetical protein